MHHPMTSIPILATLVFGITLAHPLHPNHPEDEPGLTTTLHSRDENGKVAPASEHRHVVDTTYDYVDFTKSSPGSSDSKSVVPLPLAPTKVSASSISSGRDASASGSSSQFEESRPSGHDKAVAAPSVTMQDDKSAEHAPHRPHDEHASAASSASASQEAKKAQGSQAKHFSPQTPPPPFTSPDVASLVRIFGVNPESFLATSSYMKQSKSSRESTTDFEAIDEEEDSPNSSTFSLLRKLLGQQGELKEIVLEIASRQRTMHSILDAIGGGGRVMEPEPVTYE